MDSIDIFFDYDGKKIKFSFSENSSVEEALNKFSKFANLNMKENQTTFLYNAKVLNRFLNKTLKEMNLRGKVIRVITKSPIAGGGGL